MFKSHFGANFISDIGFLIWIDCAFAKDEMNLKTLYMNSRFVIDRLVNELQWTINGLNF